jgi:hypothetical protein
LGSIALIAFSVGVVSVNEFGIAGFSFVLGPGLLLAGGIVVVAIYQFHFFNLAYYTSNLRDQIRGLCKMVGLDPKTSVGEHFVLGIPNVDMGMFLPSLRGESLEELILFPLLCPLLSPAFPNHC